MDHPETTSPGGGAKKSPFDDLGRDELINKCKGFLAIAQKAKLAKAELNAELESCKIQLDKSEKEKKTISESLKTLQELVDSLTEQKLNFITEVDSAHGKIRALTTTCARYEEDIKSCKADVIVKDNKIVEINKKISDLDIEVTSLKRQNNRLLEENEQLLGQLTEFEARSAEFNNIGMQQREQLKILEESVHTEEHYKTQIEELNNHIKQLEGKIQNNIDFEAKYNETNELYENEKAKKEKANVKLRSYKDKILKCAGCINQLKNSRFILSKTVKEYSENIPKWQNDIIKASKVLDKQISQLNNENLSLKERLAQLEKELDQVQQIKMNDNETDGQITVLTEENGLLKHKVDTLDQQLTSITNENSYLKSELDEMRSHLEEDKLLKESLNKCTQKLNEMSYKYNELESSMQTLKQENETLKQESQNNIQDKDVLDNLNLQIKALESEKSILVKEKLNARDNVVELENQNRILTDKITKLKSELQTVKSQLEYVLQEKEAFEIKFKADRESEVNLLKCNIMAQQEQFNLLKKEHDDLQDLNGLLKEEVETLKLSLEQPKDDNLSDLNVSLQTDIVKLETKLAAYKQENASLLSEIKEARAKSKECDSVMADYEDAKSKLASYKSENTELLNEMKEINQVLKERGEAISKLQKAVSEMEKLVETYEKDRDSVNEEKIQLLKKIETLESEIKDAEQKTNENKEAANYVNQEIENALKNLSLKDGIISSLKEEVERLKQQQIASADLPNEDMSTSTISKAEEHSRMKDLDETFEEKYTKLRIFALKLKKKLNETTSQLQQAEKDKAKLEKLLSENKPVVEKDELDSPKAESVAVTASERIELEDRVRSLTAALDATKNVTTEVEKLKAELVCKTQQLSSEIEAHKVTKENLEKAKRDIKKKNVLSLEMEDYERSMKELSNKMEESKKKMMQMESTIDTQEGTITAMKTQIKLLEEQIKTEERQNRLVKEELQHAIEDGKEKENLIQMKNNIVSKLEQDLEDEKRKNEESDFEMTALLSDKEKVIMSLGEDKAELNNKVKKLEFKCSELNEKLRITNIELADLKTEYTSYKVRAQAVLRQNQTVDHSQEEQLKEETAALRAQIETLTAKLTTAQDQLVEKTAEVESARRRVAEATNEASRAQQRTTRLHADLARLSQQIESERTQNKLQVSTLTQCYKTQISELEAKLQKETEVLRKQLSTAEERRKTGNVAMTSLDDANRNQYMLPVIPKDESSDGEMDINVSMIPREEGEGSESAPSPPPSKPYLVGGGSGRSPVPLERLLEEGVPDDETMDTSSLALTPDQEIADLKRRLNAQHQRVKHVTVLLSESERECARMAQLSDLLKAELRRVRGATANAHNTEYMKNVTLKFLTLPPGDERSRLVPVLQKILTLTQEETHKINAVAKGMDPNPSKGWGSYLPWPGGK
ncbi:GRIP and coiled-coil domain-containing protein 2-like isoform X1 [Trichoplusia ni]|uniref:GRIP and coiled-coil domain-containing protein 2-like isoform X1 n=1 Tax=Trichoplusia ni TaxID=7111 RepID=A0A7E5VCZ7_TRINI|nr:GRIP and coiled-coil domain-containing protein 2-like isoform X1 [Trichoplusia ni]